jgi:hypothetical protein
MPRNSDAVRQQSGSIERRRFLTAAAVAVAGTSVISLLREPEAEAATSSGATAQSGQFALGTVVGEETVGPNVELSVGGDHVVAEIEDFPAGWEISPGDRLVVDMANRRVFPYTVMEQQGQDLLFRTVNGDAGAVRTIAIYSS